MFVLIWATLLLSVRSNDAQTGALEGRRPHCFNGFCITLIEEEITAEAGLCVVIPCSFTTGYSFIPRHLVWYKCESFQQRCSDSDIIFHSNENNKKIQTGFIGRVSLIEPDVSRRICSIIINDLNESDSGSYQLRVNGLYFGSTDGFTFSPRATVSIKGLTQKPTVLIPPLTEGQQTTLTCTAPGVCSGSAPTITWMWRGAGRNDSHITGNTTEILTALTKRHTSTLTFNTSAEHLGTEVTCKVSFPGNVTTEETVTLNVTHMRKPKITGKTSVREGETLNLTCSVESNPPSLVIWTKYSDGNLQNITNLQNTELLQSTLLSSNVTANDSGCYICTVKHLNNTVTDKVYVSVIHTSKPVITGDTTVKEGDVLNLTCSVRSFPPSNIMWTKPGSNKVLSEVSATVLQNHTEPVTLFIPNVTAEHSGQYVCTGRNLDMTVTAFVDVTVTWFSKVQNGSGCKVGAELLTCVCTSQGFPLPTIKWPLLNNHNKYSVTTTVSNHTVNSSISLTVKGYSQTSVECVSSNENGEAKVNLTIQKNLSEPDVETKKLLSAVLRLETIIAFLIGFLLSALLCCLAKKCRRKKQKCSDNLDATLEMVSTQEDSLIYDGQVAEDDYFSSQEAVEDEAVAAEKTAPELDNGPNDVEYANIDFSLLKRKSPSEAAKKRESTETEYAEVKKEVKEDKEYSSRDEGEMLEDEAMIEEEDDETKPCVLEGEDMEVYSNVQDIMGEM